KYSEMSRKEQLISLTPHSSGVILASRRSRTVSTVSQEQRKLVKQFAMCRSPFTPLKRGVNENRTHRPWVKFEVSEAKREHQAALLGVHPLGCCYSIFVGLRRLLLGLAAIASLSLQAQVIESDVCIYCGTAAGVAAGEPTARKGKKVVIVEIGGHVGRMTSGGLGATEIGDKGAVGGIAREF